MKTGLASASFPENSVDEIISAAAAAGLNGIEWDEEAHVPIGELEAAAETGRKTAEARLTVISYRTRYCLGKSENPTVDFGRILDSAAAMGAPNISITGSVENSAQTDAFEWVRLVNEARMLSVSAASKGITLALECRDYTAADEFHAAHRFIQAVGRNNMCLFWQPNLLFSEQYNLTAARSIGRSSTNIYVTVCNDGGHSLADDADIWRRYISLLGANHGYLLQFQPGASIGELPDAASVLKSWLRRGSKN